MERKKIRTILLAAGLALIGITSVYAISSDPTRPDGLFNGLAVLIFSIRERQQQLDEIVAVAVEHWSQPDVWRAPTTRSRRIRPDPAQTPRKLSCGC